MDPTMSQKLKIARYPAARMSSIPEEVDRVIGAVHNTGFSPSEMAAIFCKPDFSAWHMMTKKRIFYELIFPPPSVGSIVALRSTTAEEMLRAMGMNGAVCPDCRGGGMKVNTGSADIFFGKCKACGGTGFIDKSQDVEDDEITLQMPAVPAVPLENPVSALKSDMTDSKKGGAREKIYAFLQDVKRAYIPVSRDVIGRKCAGKEITKEILIDVIVDTFIDAILDAEEKSG